VEIRKERRVSLPSYLWVSQAANPPARWDLRLLDWRLLGSAAEAGDGRRHPALLDWRAASRPPDWRTIRQPDGVVAVGVDLAEDRAALLAAGFGDALGSQVALVELAARLVRLAAFASALPRQRQAGPVLLDLFHRDGRIGPTWLGLHPREFALLWRLAETPDARVSRHDLLADVWRLEHLPETNSLEVHVSRLRAKLAISQCAWLVRTHPDGGYQMCLERPGPREALDRPVAIGNSAAREQFAED
jgi:two-component system OmpR family response regulator